MKDSFRMVSPTVEEYILRQVASQFRAYGAKVNW